MDNITRMGEMLAETVLAELEEGYRLTDVERLTRQVMQEVGRRAVGELVQQAERYPAPSVSCPGCGQSLQYQRRRPGQLRLLFGKVTIERAYYHCGACREGYYPLDESLGLRVNALSEELERLAGLTGVAVPFGKGSALLAALALVELSDQTLAKAARAYGEAVQQQEQEWQAAAQDQEILWQQEHHSRRPLRLYGSLDATKLHTRVGAETPWRDLKLGAWYEARGRPPKKPTGNWRIQAEAISYFTDIATAAEFGQLFWATGVQRQAQLARELIILADGAEWIWNLVDEHFPKAIQILDWFHASSYLMPVAKARFGTVEAQTAWVEQAKQALWAGQVQTIITWCQQLTKAEDSNDPAFVAARYYQQNQSRMDYPAYRRQGYQIGSGTIESAAKQIGAMRMKVPGAIWNEGNARQVAKARAAFLSGQWDELARYRALPAAL